MNRTGPVLANDASDVKPRFFRSTTNPGSGAGAYTIFHDVDGSGSILADDFSSVKSRFFTTLPGPEPLRAAPAARPATAASASSVSVIVDPVVRQEARRVPRLTCLPGR